MKIVFDFPMSIFHQKCKNAPGKRSAMQTHKFLFGLSHQPKPHHCELFLVRMWEPSQAGQWGTIFAIVATATSSRQVCPPCQWMLKCWAWQVKKSIFQEIYVWVLFRRLEFLFVWYVRIYGFVSLIVFVTKINCYLNQAIKCSLILYWNN